MNIYFAPMEGVTDSVYRRAHKACFSGVSKYFIPFISPTRNLTFTSRELSSVSPSENEGLYAVPQILTKNAEHFLWTANSLADVGYKEINLNLGCPSGTVTAKGKGSGLLRDPDALAAFLDEVYTGSPIAVSLKTRVGFESIGEWPRLLEIFSRYPVHELIVHPRTRREFYSGTPHAELCRDVDSAKLPLVYNGDVFTPEDYRRICEAFPGATAVMVGRGLIANPALAQEINGGEKLTVDMLRSFHDRLFAAYSERWPRNFLVGHMHETMSYMLYCFEDVHKIRKTIRKATTPETYLDAVRLLFESRPLLDQPYFRRED